MKNWLLLSMIMIGFSLPQVGQTFQIDFNAIGSAVILDSISVENLTKSTHIMCYSDDTLHLNITSGVEDPIPAANRPLVFPNPMLNETNIAFYVPESGDVNVVVYAMSGTEIIRSERYVSSGWQNLRIDGLSRGVYLVNIAGNRLSFTAKLISVSDAHMGVNLGFSEAAPLMLLSSGNQRTKGIKSMVYDLGDNLRLIGFSGVFRDTVYDSPVGSKTITFIFSIQPASIATTPISAITPSSASGGGAISSDGGSPVTARGVCWSTSPLPTTADLHTVDSFGTGSFTSHMTSLTPATPYYVRAYATNSAGTAYGNQESFTTAPVSLPVVTTTAITAITATAATSGGEVVSDGGATVTSRGVCWSTNPNPTTIDPHTTNGTGSGVFSSSITGLTLGTTYYVRAYATNSVGTAYGNELNFSTTPLQIGDQFGGGVVAYILQPGDPGYIAGQVHGLIAAPYDQSASGNEWGCYYTSINTSLLLGTGQANTTAILAGCPSPTTAALVCDILVLNSYTDWYLPSRDELNKLYINRVAIGGFVITGGYRYWSSSEVNADLAWAQSFTTGSMENWNWKDNLFKVRAVRSF